MESSTDRCPQCGAAIRSSARFCVTCGIKLPEPSRAGTHVSGWASRETPEPHVDTVLAMPAPESAEASDMTTIADLDTPAEGDWHAEPITADDKPETPVSGWSNWPSPVSESAAMIDEPELRGDDDLDIDTAPERGTDALVLESPDQAVAAESVQTESLQISPDEEAELEPDAAPAIDVEVLESTSATASPLDEAAHEEMMPFDEAQDRWTAGPEPIETSRVTAIEIELLDDESNIMTHPVDEASATAASLRALALLDELRALIPAIPAHPVVETDRFDVDAIRERLLTARGETAPDRFTALRDIVQEALSRPRDVEVVLRLSRRVEDMDALLSEWDRLSDAFDQLIAELR